MYGNMNPGLLICRCLDKVNGDPVVGAGVMITWVEADASFGGRLPLFDSKGSPATSVEADTDSSGVAFVEFFWDPTHIGWLLSSSPAIRVSAIGPAARHDNWFNSNQSNKSYLSERITGQRLYECVNLGQIQNGGKGMFQFNSTESSAIGAASKLKQILEFRAKTAGEKIPKLQILKVMRPTTEMYALLGGFDIQMTPQ
jgi:hypothetical protein